MLSQFFMSSVFMGGTPVGFENELFLIQSSRNIHGDQVKHDAKFNFHRKPIYLTGLFLTSSFFLARDLIFWKGKTLFHFPQRSSVDSRRKSFQFIFNVRVVETSKALVERRQAEVNYKLVKL